MEAFFFASYKGFALVDIQILNSHLSHPFKSLSHLKDEVYGNRSSNRDSCSLDRMVMDN